MRVFGVDYQFLSCGSVFTDGLVHAAADLNVDYAHAEWNAPDLDRQIAAFAPDLVFVVHGRRFAQRYPNFSQLNAPLAVWLLDEPYEVDDTSAWSSRFDYVFVNDAATVDRHKKVFFDRQHDVVVNVSYLPVCYDPHVHYAVDEPKIRGVGFIGGGNSTRDRYLSALNGAGLLDYVVGGHWSDEGVQQRCLSFNISPAQTAMLYRHTRIILNVFRETHHFNRLGTVATSMNPRIYEALACGALVVSEARQEIADVIPELRAFTTEQRCVELVRALVDDPVWAAQMQASCKASILPHTYASRLRSVIKHVGLAVAA